jgi:hypothetical protein
VSIFNAVYRDHSAQRIIIQTQERILEHPALHLNALIVKRDPFEVSVTDLNGNRTINF